MSEDPREILAKSPMRGMQIAAVAMCVGLNALDGFDVLSISFASPGIAAEWNMDRAALGIVLSMELIGMAIGSILIGSIADRIGRRPTILACLVIMAVGMYLASHATGVNHLLQYRFLTGLGIGGMLASTNAMVAEFSNARHRNLSVIIMAAGYPVGATIGGSIASMLLTTNSWHSVFEFGAIATIATVPLVYFLLPESVDYLVHRRPRNALKSINKTLTHLGHPTVSELPPPPEKKVDGGFLRLFSPALVRTTFLLTVAYFAHIMTFYFILKWIPKIVVDMGHVASVAGGVLVWANIGGASGAVVLGLLTQKFGVKALVIGAMIIGAVMVVLFGRGPTDLQQLSMISAFVGFCTNAGVVGLYAMFAQHFPTEVRAGGTGFVIGVGRGGAALGPIIAGFLFASGQGLQIVAIVMASGSIIAAIALMMLRSKKADGPAIAG
ncbi:MFS transporter [Hyphomonas sp.]|jgi:benzoate transport|uniref:MFS transporter n=1 Tax=Hyphomonas sp. TaxID=87 RepID=UPI0039E2CABC